jgi:hypothetical protein
LFLGAGEELSGVGEDGRYGREGDTVVLEVDEAGGLEALENGGGGLLLCGGVTREEGGEVDELEVFSGVIESVYGERTGISRSSCETAESTVMFAMLFQCVACLQLNFLEVLIVGDGRVNSSAIRVRAPREERRLDQAIDALRRPSPVQLAHHEMPRWCRRGCC